MYVYTTQFMWAKTCNELQSKTTYYYANTLWINDDKEGNFMLKNNPLNPRRFVCDRFEGPE